MTGIGEALRMVQRPPVGWREYDSSNWGDASWSEWYSLDPDELTSAPDRPGLYRVRHQKLDGLSYIGESGDVKRRMRTLARGVHNDKMPYRDPHTAAPCLWAIRDKFGDNFEIAYTVPDVAHNEQQRKGLEAAYIATYRLEMSESPPANFGRIISGYRQSTYRSGGTRGGLIDDTENEPNSKPGLEPRPWEHWHRVTDEKWMGSEWSDSHRLSERLDADPPDLGLYRIWFPDQSPPLVYIGMSSNISRRLYKHEKTYGGDALFAYAGRPDLEYAHQRGEAETDLIGAHYIAHGHPPQAQFGYVNQFTED